MTSADYDPKDWFWTVAGDTSQAWSSASSSYVGKWPLDRVTRIASETDLTDVLRPYGLRGPFVASDDVQVERSRRLAQGFDYDFGKDRGVHRIGTTPADMLGWDEVSKLSSALLALNLAAYPIDLVTDTGPVTVTATEWQGVLIAAAQFRQPIWAASFILQGMDPVPADFTDDRHWRRP